MASLRNLSVLINPVLRRFSGPQLRLISSPVRANGDKNKCIASSEQSSKSGDASKTQSHDEKISNSVPNVDSTSLGLDANPIDDPLKWQKFAWKYAGALVLFGIAYTLVNSYTDRLIQNKEAREKAREASHWSSERDSDKQGKYASIGDVTDVVGPRVVSGEDQRATQPESTLWHILPPMVEVDETALNAREELELRELELAARLKEMRSNRDGRWQGEDIELVENELTSVERELRLSKR